MGTRPIADQACDVLIVGYGPVGAALAAQLGRYGVRTVVVEREKEIFTAPRAIALDNEALRILQGVGLREDAFAKVTIPRVRMRCPHVGEFASIDVSGTVDEHPKLVTFYQPELERSLRALVANQASVCTYAEVELVGLVDDGHSVRAAVKDLSSGRDACIRATYVIGADGARSKVRALIGQEAKGQSYSEDWLVVDAVGVPEAIDHVEFLCDPRRPTPHMPGPGDRTRWEFMLHPGESREALQSEESVRALIAPWTGGANVTLERRAIYQFSARSCDRFQVGRVFLAGDAAHVTPPFAGQGLVAGLRDAGNLAWKLAWTVQGRTAASTLDSYDQERRPHAEKMIALARVMGSLVMPPSRTRAVIMHGAMKALRLIPSARTFLDDLGMKPSMTYPRGLFVRGRGAFKHGSWFPQTRMRRSTGEAERSDDVLGAGFSLVGIGADPSRALSPHASSAWNALRSTIVAIDDDTPRRNGVIHVESLDTRLGSRNGTRPWCVVVRPDRTVLHDGPVAAADRIVRESLQLLGAPI